MSLFRFLCRNKISKEEARLLPWHLQEGYRYDEQVRDFLGDEEAGAAFFPRLTLSVWKRGFALSTRPSGTGGRVRL